MTTKKQIKTIDEYIKTFPKNIQNILQKTRRTIQKAAPEAVETLSYGIPTFDLKGKHLVHFAAFKIHIGFYPTPSGISAFRKELSAYRSAKGSAQFPLDKAIPYSLINQIVKFRVKEESVK